jgi:hypothetical protein
MKFLAVALLLTMVSIGCSYKSADSQSFTSMTNSGAQPTGASSTAVTQDKEQCTLTITAAPAISGIKLGMTAQEVLSLFSGNKESVELRATLTQPPGRFGMRTLQVTPIESKDRFKGIRDATLRLVDDRVYNFRIGYEGPEWPNVDRFVEKFVTGTNLPPASQWEAYVGMDTQLKTLSCAGFTVQLFAGGTGGNLNYADITDVAADKALKERRVKARAQASPSPAAPTPSP